MQNKKIKPLTVRGDRVLLWLLNCLSGICENNLSNILKAKLVTNIGPIDFGSVAKLKDSVEEEQDFRPKTLSTHLG